MKSYDERMKEASDEAFEKLEQRIRELEADLAKTKSELAKWQRPFDQERFDAAKQQASRKDSLAAMQVYIIALEHGFKAVEAERDAYKADAERVDWLEKLFAPSWDGTIGRPRTWTLVGHWRHIVKNMRGHSFRDAIDAAMKGKP
jgi:DNA repair exonuclease SbcCD ATPase subunit